MSSTLWTRLIRFVAAETSQVHIGQPISSNLDIGLAAHKNETIKAFEIVGSALDPAAKVTENVLTVKKLLAPLPRKDVKIVRCLGLNYADHAAEAKLPIPPVPVLFYKPVTTLIGPSSNIIIPKVAQPVQRHIPDYEVELAVVIGKTAKDIPEEDALNFVLGYTGSNDISFRAHQKTTSQWCFSKSFDDTTPFGPCLVSAHSLQDPQCIPLSCTINDRVRQNGSTADQIFSVRRVIAHLSQGTTLEPGSIILTGTPSGVGFARRPLEYLKHGDRIETWLGAGIGTLINDVVEEGHSREESKL